VTGAPLVDLLLHFASLSLLAIGGALGAAPELQRNMVEERGWITHAQFTDAIVVAQASPGPNILFVTLLGFHAAGLPGALATTVGILVPSSLATYWGWRMKRRHEDSRLVRAIRLGLSPIAVGLTASAGWIVAVGANGSDGVAWAVTALVTAAVLVTRMNLLWLIGAGALLGALGVLG
jgi:chromate transporter